MVILQKKFHRLGYNNFRPIYYHIVNGTINAEYYL